jgi:hypothetical protein
MCNCREIVLEKMLEKMEKEYGFTKVIEEPEFENCSIYPIVQPYFRIIGKYMQGKAKRNFRVSFYPTFCPFCGEKIEEEAEQ